MSTTRMSMEVIDSRSLVSWFISPNIRGRISTCLHRDYIPVAKYQVQQKESKVVPYHFCLFTIFRENGLWHSLIHRVGLG